jgi:hypothetical protein
MRIPVPAVLAAASAMISVGGVGVYWAYEGRTAAPSHIRRAGPIDRTRPEASAESFLRAWGQRAHADALATSIGPARRRVRERMRQQSRLRGPKRAPNGAPSTRAPLALRIRESETLSEERLIFRGTAEGRSRGKPYERPVRLLLVRHDGGWRVARMQLGPVATEDGERPANQRATGAPSPGAGPPTKRH